MITYISSSIWQSPLQTLVNTVNTVGVMGKGIALEYKKRFPEMYLKYKELCNNKRIDIGVLWLYRGDNRNILNFPTKIHWRNPSRLEYIEKGLEKFVSTYEMFGITSISFPLLGTGNGGLDWKSQVMPIMEYYLKKLPIPIFIHLRTERTDFIPEHLLPIPDAIPFDELLFDISKLEGKTFNTLTEKNEFTFKGIIDGYLVFLRKGSEFYEKIPLEHLRMLWGDLFSYKIIDSAKAPGRIGKHFSLVFPLLASIPYIKTVYSAKSPELLSKQPSRSLMMAKDANNNEEASQHRLVI